MAIRTLSLMLEAIGQGSGQVARNDQSYGLTVGGSLPMSNDTFLEQGQVENISGDGLVEVFIHSQGLRQVCQPVTDEPLEFGMLVWVSKTKEDQWIVHGSTK